MEYKGLVWKGKIIKKMDNDCPHGDYICEFSCDFVKPVNVLVCGQLFVDKGENKGDIVSIPMKFNIEGKIYNPLLENTPVSKISW